MSVEFILLVFIIRMTSFSKRFGKNKVSMYCKLDIRYREITFISNASLITESENLINSNYELIVLADLDIFVHQQDKLPDKSFLIIFKKSYIPLLKRVVPTLIEKNISMIIFLPMLKSTKITRHQKKKYKQMSDLFFVAEFEKYLSQYP